MTIRSIGAALAAQAIPQQVTTQMMNTAAIVRNDIRAPGLAQAGVVDKPVAGGGGDLDNAVGNLPQMGGAAATDYTADAMGEALAVMTDDEDVYAGQSAHNIRLFREELNFEHQARPFVQWLEEGRP